MREATDLGIGAAVRRELAGRRIDLSKIKFPVKAGVVTLQGELVFVGIDKTTDETAIELKFIESSLRKIAGVKDTIFELESWSKNDSGVWESSAHPSTTVHMASGSGASSGEGLYCDECDMVIRFCPCCGKPLTTAARSAAKPRRIVPPIKPMIKKKRPTIGETLGQREPVSMLPTAGIGSQGMSTPSIPAPPQPIAKPVISEEKPTMPVAPAVRPTAPARLVEKPAVPVSPAKPAIPAAKPATAPVAQPIPAVEPRVAAPIIPVAKPEIRIPAKPATPIPVAPTKPISPTPAARPVSPAPSTPAAPTITEKPAVDEMNLDNLNLDLDNVNPKEPVVPKPDFMKSDELTEDLFGSLIDNLSQSGSDSSSEQAESDNFTQDPASTSEGIPEINLDSLDAFSATTPEGLAPEPTLEDISDLLPPMKPSAAPATEEFSDDIADLLPPMKPTAKPAIAKPAPAQEPDPFAGFDDDTPLPPMKPADVVGSFEDDDTPLPPMRPKAAAGKESKDPFAALFSEADLGLGMGGGEGAKDPFANLDLDLDVLEVFPSDDLPTPPPQATKPATGVKKPGAGIPPIDDNPFNIDNIIDLDSPVEDKPKAGKKPAKDPFDLDDFDIGKFKL